MRLNVLFLLLSVSAPIFAAQPKVTLTARGFNPGEIILISVENQRDGSAPEGEFLGKELAFWRASTGTYQAFAGIDLDVSTGTFWMNLRLANQKGKEKKWRKKIEIVFKEFPREELTVDSGFVHLKKKDAERAEKEAARLKEIFSRRTLEKIFDGPFIFPIPGAQTGRFGSRRVFNQVPKAPHSGADIKAKSGTPVAASARGRVVLADDFFYPGKIVLLDHGFGVFSLYAHLSEILVKEGQTVSRGEKLGLVGATGRVTGPHLHWAVKYFDARIDPESLVFLPL